MNGFEIFVKAKNVNEKFRKVLIAPKQSGRAFMGKYECKEIKI